MVKMLAASWLLLCACATTAALQTCVVPSQYKCSKGKASDAAAISEVFARCSQDSIIEFSAGVDYNVFSPIKATNLSNVIISLKGNWNLPQNVTTIQQLVAAASGSLTWFTLGGKNVQILGTPNVRTEDESSPATGRMKLTTYRSPRGGSNPTDRPGGILTLLAALVLPIDHI